MRKQQGENPTINLCSVVGRRTAGKNNNNNQPVAHETNVASAEGARTKKIVQAAGKTTTKRGPQHQ